MRNQEWDSALAQLNPLDLAQFVFCLFLSDAVYSVSPFGIVYKTEILSSLFDGNNVHEASRVGGIGTDFAIDFYETLHDNCFGLASVQGIL